MDAVFAQYGALGAIAFLALLAVRVLFQREVKAHQQDTDRADRLEVELKRLNDLVLTQYITTLSQATVAMAEALSAIREVDNARQQPREGGAGAPYQDKRPTR